MFRREFLTAVPAALLSTAFADAARAAGRTKITDVRVAPLKVVREVGELEPAWAPGSRMAFREGGGSVLEIVSDQGAVGLGPGLDPAALPRVKALLVGKDPFDIEGLYGPIRAAGGGGRGVACIEIALWDLIGKLAQQPVYKLWGAAKDKVPAYASLIQLSTVEERVRMATRLKSEGWKAIKIRLHHQTLREDIRLATAIRAAVGDDFTIMVDCNQAQSATGWQPGIRWDFARAVETARQLQKLGVYWIEEPLPRFSFDDIAELNRLVEIPVAGGENNVNLHEFRAMLQQGVYDIVQPDVMNADGVTGMRRIANMAGVFNRNCVPHHGGGNFGTIAQLHLIASWSNAPWIEILHDPPIGAYTTGFSIFESPPLVDKDGFLNLPQTPGFGVEIKRSLLG